MVAREPSAAARRVRGVLDRADGPLTVDELAARLRLHPNTVREHVDRLVAAGAAVRAPRRDGSRGRPGWEYSARATVAEYREKVAQALTRIALDGFGRREEDAVAVAVDTARAEARLMAAPEPGDDALTRVRVELERMGGRCTRAGDTVRLDACPLASVAVHRPEVYCRLHVAMLEGVAGSRLDVRTGAGRVGCLITEATPASAEFTVARKSGRTSQQRREPAA
ncbi:MAG: helix-turn-helix domain-containing protein [Demequina sp.]|uniref:helix-turn-helix domain-containing protein n=1 Tax=Demequina sp. TaxID=2050685 RepID=UPI003A8B59D1